MKKTAEKGLVSKVAGALDSLKKAERRVAEYVIKNPDKIIHKSIMEVAKNSGVADATVVRFCRTFGLKGFQDLKIRLARELVSERERVYEDLSEADTAEVVLKKVFQANIRALEDTLNVIDSKEFKKAVALLKNTSRVFFIGVGTSGPNVIDAYNKFSRLGINCLCQTDSHLQVMTAAILQKGDVVVAVSHSGSTKDPIETIKVAKRSGAKVICITNNSLSPLTKVADVKLFTASRETKFRSEAMSSRLAQTSILNSLYMAVALADMKMTLKYNKKIEDAIVQKQF